MLRYWYLLLAYLRLSNWAVCEMSKNVGPWDDFHDYPDSDNGEPAHLMLLTCKRCGKSFYI